MTVHYFQHVPFEGLGYIKNWLDKNGHKAVPTVFSEADYQFPKIENVEALVVMGGPMDMDDEDKYPWFKKEKEFIEACIAQQKKVLGICLGAQLIAHCLGAEIVPAKEKEIGWFKVSPTEECRQIPWLYDLFQNHPTVFHWHRNRFQIPNGGFSFLDSEVNSHQGLFYSEKVIGLQCHLEVTDETVEQMITFSGQDIQGERYAQSASLLRSGLVHAKACHDVMDGLLNHWMG